MIKLHKKILDGLLDYRYMLLGAASGVIYRNTPKHYLGHVINGKTSIVLIPGIFGRWSFMKSLGDKISLCGHPVYIVPRLGYNLLDIPTSGKILLELIKEITEKSKEENIIFVAHSKGGLIGKYFLSHFNEENKVLGMVAIATPFSGSAMARLIPFGSIKELDNDSEIIKDLQTHFDINKKIISIIPEYDNHVWAEKGGYLDGAENIEVPVRGHHKIIFDKKVQEIILGSIEKITQLNKKSFRETKQ